MRVLFYIIVSVLSVAIAVALVTAPKPQNPPVLHPYATQTPANIQPAN